MKTFVVLGSLLAAMAVAAGAMGAHVLAGQLSPKQMETFHLAANYQLVHAIGLIAIGLGATEYRSRFVRLAGWLLLLGIVLFSGCLFAWVLTDIKFFVYPVPIGGTAFIVGWIALAIGTYSGCCGEPKQDE